MKQWCDAPFTINIPELDLNSVRDIRVTLEQGPYKVKTTDVEVLGPHDLKCLFTQEQTGIFSSFESVTGVINYISNATGLRCATQNFVIPVDYNPDDEELVGEATGNE